MFDVKKQSLPTPQQAFSKLVSGKTENQIVELPIDIIEEIDDQPFKIHEDKIERIAESMLEIGQLEPIMVIPNKNKYLILAGRHRFRACQLNGQTTVKAIVKDETNPDKQRLILLATNNDRNNDYVPSERAFAYLEQMQLLKKLGSKSTTAKIAEESGTNRKIVHRYIQLTKLIKPLLYKVDAEEITVGAGYELSFLSEEQQTKLNIFLINNPTCKINKENARKIRNSPDNLNEIFFNNESEKTSNAPKAEKKIKTISSKTDNCPSGGQKKEISYEVQMTISYIMYKEAYGIYKQLISQLCTAAELENYIIDRYSENGVMYSGVLSQPTLPFEKFKNSNFNLQFSKNKLIVSFGGKTYKVPYSELDGVLRAYARKYINTDDKISMLRG